MAAERLLLPRGIYTPLPTFFSPDDEDVDLDAFAQHVRFVARAGTIPVVAGSAGEAPHLSRAERTQLISTARSALDACGLGHVPLVAGVGASSTRETISLACDAADAGADFAMVIPPGYYAGQLQKEGGRALGQFFLDVAVASPIPIVLYNFPAVSGGIDLDSDLVVRVVRASDNVVGVKLTCGNVGKITRINAVISSSDFRKCYPRRNPNQEFQVIDGYIDILLPSISSGAAGAISGLPNIVPCLCVRLWELASSDWGPKTPQYAEARRLQQLLALADGVAAGIGVPGLKMLVHKVHGHSPYPRKPLLPMSFDEADRVMNDVYIRRVLAEEVALQSL